MCPNAHEAKTLYDTIAAAVAANEKAAAKRRRFSTDMDDEYDGMELSDVRRGTEELRQEEGCAPARRRAARRRAAPAALPAAALPPSAAAHYPRLCLLGGPQALHRPRILFAVHLVAPGQRTLGRFLPALD